MEEEVTSDYFNANEDVFENIEVNEDAIVNEDTVVIENEQDKIVELENNIDEPNEGMEFDSLDELMAFYAAYAKQKGFAIAKRTSKKVEGTVRYVMIECTRAGTTNIKSTNPLKMRPNSKIGCKAKLTAFYCPNGKWSMRSIELCHNHEMSPGKSRYYKCNRFLQPHVKRRLSLNDKTGIRINKNFNSLVVEAGGHENLEFIEKDVRNYINEARRLQLGEGDANAMHAYFLRMQADNSDFFYTMDLDEEGRLKNVFWADARSRAAFKEFGDVVTFDTTYLVNKYDMPFAPFVGVNHHGQSVLLGCGLISSEDTNTFTWLFENWLTCMSYPPNAIITDQCRAMKKAIEIVFPNVRHRWCLWHIMKKLPEKLKGYKEYESMKYVMQNIVYDSLTPCEFDAAWGKFIDKYELQRNEWLLGLFEERNRWVPAFVRDTFWAGMSTTQRSESMHAFFDGYINSKTTLKQFVEQYENALAKKVENEKQEDFNSYNSSYPCATPFGIERQFQCLYTRSKFKEFQTELFGKIYCNSTLTKEELGFIEYEVREQIRIGENHRPATFKLIFNDETKEVNCNCRLFEYRGIMCRHQLMVYNERGIFDEVPPKYILKRWSKHVKRRHSKIRIKYDDWSDRPEARRFEKMCNAFTAAADVAVEHEEWCDEVMTKIFHWERGGFKDISTNAPNNSTSCGDAISKESRAPNILDPLVSRSKGRPPSKRKVGNVEKAVKKKAYDEQVNVHGTQESIVLSSSIIQPNMPTLTPYMQPPNMGIGGMDSTHFQGYHNPFWRLDYNFASMPPSSSIRGLSPLQNYTGEFMQGCMPWRPGAPPGAPHD